VIDDANNATSTRCDSTSRKNDGSGLRIRYGIDNNDGIRRQDMLQMLLMSPIWLPVPLIEALIQAEGEETPMRDEEDNNKS
jgi:hypothetical protein